MMKAALWAVTSYFNPTRSRWRTANYRTFRESLAAPLLTVEWSPDARFELGPGDADMLVQISGGDLMWQKERLLNLGISRLPTCCRHVAWLDCDILFENSGWMSEAMRRLDDVKLVQLYDRVLYSAPPPVGSCIESGSWPHGAIELERTGYASVHENAPTSDRARPVATDDLATFQRLPSAGFAWAADRELLVRNPLFDTWVCGGGDSAYILAATGKADWVLQQQGLSAAHGEHLLRRARGLCADVAGRMGYVAGSILHLWHGAFEQRRYRGRHEILARHGFDPGSFLRMADSGAWCWGRIPPTLASAVADYLRARDEPPHEIPVSQPAPH